MVYIQKTLPKEFAMKRETRKPRAIRMKDAEWEEFQKMGGPEWLRFQIAKSAEIRRKLESAQ